MDKKIILSISLILLVLVGVAVFVSALNKINPQPSKSLNSGNGVCEYYHKKFSVGEKDSITINGATLNIEYLGNEKWKLNDYEGNLRNDAFFVHNQNPNLRGVRFDFSFMGQSEDNFGLKEVEYYPWDCQGWSESTGMISEIKIKEGWNLVRCDLILKDCYYALSGELCKDDVLVSYIYIPALNKYFREEELEEQYDTDPVIRDFFDQYCGQQSSKWIYVKPGAGHKKLIDSFGAYIPGRNLILDKREYPYRLKQGWNLVFVHAFMVYNDSWEEDPLSLEDMKGNCEFQSAYVWDAENQKWRTTDNFLNDKNILKNEGVGTGFIVKVVNDCTLGYKVEEIPGPPILP